MSSLLFGEIVEPTTRALIDEDLEEYPEYIEKPLEWEGKYETPHNINTLVFVETQKLKKLFFHCILQSKKPVGKLQNAGVEMYSLEDNLYIITYFEHKDLNTGEIVEAFEKWIAIAKNIYTITTDSIYRYQNAELLEKPSALMRMLSNNPEEHILYTKLESPNLVTGLGANVLSYCIHTKLKCTLYIAYIDNAPLDSVNLGILLELIKKLNIPVIKNIIKDHEGISSSNLYT